MVFSLRLAIILLFTLIVFQSNSLAQQLEITEISGKDTINTRSTLVVDINSRLEVRVKRGLSSVIRDQEVKSDPSFVKELQKYNTILQIQQKIIATYNDDSRTDFMSLYDEFIDLLSQFPNELRVFKYMFNNYPNNSPGWIKNVFIDYGREFSKRKPTQKKNSLSDKFTVGIKAEIKTKGQKPRQIRVLGYNNIEEGAFEPVEIWDTSYSEEELKAARTLVETASKTLGEVKEVVQSTVRSIDIDAIKNKLEPVTKYDDSQVTSVASGLLDDLGALKTLANNTPVEEIGERLEASIEVIKDKSESLQSIYAANIISKDVLGSLMNLLQPAIDKVEELSEKVVSPTDRMYANAMSLNVDNYFHGLDDAPKGYIDLKTSGKRNNFDELHIQLSIKKANKAEPIVKELVALQLVQVNWHLETNVGVILANSIHPNSELALSREFQFAPNVNFLFKRGSRKSGFINFAQPGIGISVSTPDFDMNTIPDFSFGLVGSMFRDIVSVGISYNTAIDNTFWFVGFSLPFTGIGLPLGNVQNQAFE